MRIECPHCHNKATIKARNYLDGKKVFDLYCVCSHPNCKAEFVSQVTYMRDTKPGLTAERDVLISRLASMLNDPEKIALLVQKLPEEPLSKAVMEVLA